MAIVIAREMRDGAFLYHLAVENKSVSRRNSPISEKIKLKAISGIDIDIDLPPGEGNCFSWSANSIKGWWVEVESLVPMSMNQMCLFMVWNRKSKNVTDIACPIIRDELLSFCTLNGNPNRDYPHGDQNSSVSASLSIDWRMNEVVTEYVRDDQTRLCQLHVGYILLCAFLLRTFWYVLPPNYRSDPPDKKLNSALLLSRRTYPPRDSWNFSPSFGYAGTKGPLTTNQQTSSDWVLSGRSEQQGMPRRCFSSWAAVSRSRGRSAPCNRIWEICSHKILLQSDLAGERSQFTTENKTTSERTFVRFFSTKHRNLRITVGRWLPKETPIRSSPWLGGIYLIPITRRGSL
ncbi:uncharacterized protein LOC107809469 [Nicotiana tabacum]|uniref:Uncharacterized protein LOC107809469 n=1 Tax=Nicotiana tabacum TaxID=4097 RepID=A0AC58TNJ5_TOBAC